MNQSAKDGTKIKAVLMEGDHSLNQSVCDQYGTKDGYVVYG